MMFKILVLCVFVAAALAVPAPAVPEEKSYPSFEASSHKVEARGFSDCFNTCMKESFYMPTVTAACIARCTFGRKLNKSPDYTFSGAAAQPTPGEKSYRSFDASTNTVEGRGSGDCYMPCLISFGGPFSLTAQSFCLTKCFGRKLNNKSLDYTFPGASAQPTPEEKSYHSFDASTQKVEARGFSDCYTSCLNSLGFNIAANPICIARCTFGRKLNKSPDYTFSGAAAQPTLEEKSYSSFDASSHKVEARSFSDCFASCLNEYGYPNNPVAGVFCMPKCTFGRKLNNKSLDYTFSGASAQPMMMEQFTGEIMQVLSDVVMAQQELEQKIRNCNCAKPASPFAPANEGISF